MLGNMDHEKAVKMAQAIEEKLELPYGHVSCSDNELAIYYLYRAYKAYKWALHHPFQTAWINVKRKFL